jgi:indolepyruvate ferredoxin oxidoreductase
MALMGDSISTNLFMLGYAWQRGCIPLSEAALMQAIELNGVAVEANQRAFRWGRLAAADLDTVMRHAFPELTTAEPKLQTLDELISHRSDYLADYKNDAYAAEYAAFVQKVRQAEARLGKSSLTSAVAGSLFKLMAIKDEYEIARLFSGEAFKRKLEETFEGNYRLRFSLAPTLLARTGSDGRSAKTEYGSWIMPAFRTLSRFRRIRGTALDVFGWTKERQAERALIAEYRGLIEDLLPSLNIANLPLAVEVASVPQTIRGYGHVKLSCIEKARSRWQEQLSQYFQCGVGCSCVISETDL